MQNFKACQLKSIFNSSNLFPTWNMQEYRHEVAIVNSTWAGLSARGSLHESARWRRRDHMFMTMAKAKKSDQFLSMEYCCARSLLRDDFRWSSHSCSREGEKFWSKTYRNLPPAWHKPSEKTRKRSHLHLRRSACRIKTNKSVWTRRFRVDRETTFQRTFSGRGRGETHEPL